MILYFSVEKLFIEPEPDQELHELGAVGSRELYFITLCNV